jgi:hypothetical protein
MKGMSGLSHISANVIMPGAGFFGTEDDDAMLCRIT